MLGVSLRQGLAARYSEQRSLDIEWATGCSQPEAVARNSSRDNHKKAVDENILRRGTITALLATLGCSQSPSGRWEATQSVDVLLKKGDPQTVALVLNAGDVCALGQQWSFEKELRYKEVICPQGKGWITSDTPFKKLGG